MDANDYYLERHLRELEKEEEEQNYRDVHADEFIKKMDATGDAFGYTFHEDVAPELEDCEEWPDALLEFWLTNDSDRMNEIIEEKIRVVAYKYAEDQYLANVLLAGEF